MDVNGTRFHLLLGEHDWRQCVEEDPVPGRRGVSYNASLEELTLLPLVFQYASPAPDKRRPVLADRRGADSDRFGSRYWIDGTRTRVLVMSAGSGTTSLYWEPGLHADAHPPARHGEFEAAPEAAPAPPRAIPLAGVAVTADHYLVVGTIDPAGLLVFDLRSGGPPRQLLWPREVPFVPFDLSARRECGVFVLDRDHRRVWELDRALFVVSHRPAASAGEPPEGEFGPIEAGQPPPGEATSAFGRIAFEDAIDVDGDPIGIETAPDGSLLVLDRRLGERPSIVRRMSGDEPVLEARLEDVEVGVVPVAHAMVLVPPAPAAERPREREPLGRLFVVDEAGDQSFAFELAIERGSLTASLAREYYPMRMFGGKGLVADSKRAYYDFADGWVPLVEQKRPRFVDAATIRTPVFDGRVPATVWHRLLLDACLPPGTDVRVSSRAADDERELAVARWESEPRPYCRGGGSEQPFVDPQPSGYETWELLFQRARGRFLQLRLRLSGDGRTSPRLRALRAHYPRFSYLESYLPKVYREDPSSASFLDRFLANLEGFNTAIEDKIAASQALVDARTAPREALEWLARWFDFALDPAWSEARRRLFIRHAVDFFRHRGTAHGIELALRLALQPCDDGLFDSTRDSRRQSARIVERFRTRRTPAVVVGDPTEAAGPRVSPAAGAWTPMQGAEALHERYRAFVGRAEDPTVEFKLVPPPGEEGNAWRLFARTVLGFEPAGAAQATAWRDFLRRRYESVDALNDAYGLTGTARHASFAAVSAVTELPLDGAPLRDWYEFEAFVVPTLRSAHRFTVLLPVPAAGEDDDAAQVERRAIARRVVELQKPAHTTFDVKFFWAAFRVGEARLGSDTLVELGSRSPRLLEPAVLGREHLGETTLGGELAPFLGTRRSVGRDRLVR